MYSYKKFVESSSFSNTVKWANLSILSHTHTHIYTYIHKKYKSVEQTVTLRRPGDLEAARGTSVVDNAAP